METRGLDPRVGSLLELEPRFGGAFFFVPGPASNRGILATRASRSRRSTGAGLSPLVRSSPDEVENAVDPYDADQD